MKRILIAACSLISICTTAQNVGIGRSSPGGKLEIGNNSSIRPALMFTDSSELSMGKIRWRNVATAANFMELEALSFLPHANESYLDVTSDSLFIATFRGNGNVGIGVMTPADRLHVNGSINLNGTIKVSGNSGTAGQVLTSNGNASPTWETMRSNYPANMRAMIALAFTGIPNKLERNLRMGTRVYNTSAGAIIIADSTITINETGLYELEGKIHFRPGGISVFSEVPPTGSARIIVDYGGGNWNSFPLINQRITELNPGYYRELVPFRFTVHLTAGAVLSFPVNISNYNLDICCDGIDIFEGYIGIVKVD